MCMLNMVLGFHFRSQRGLRSFLLLAPLFFPSSPAPPTALQSYLNVFSGWGPLDFSSCALFRQVLYLSVSVIPGPPIFAEQGGEELSKVVGTDHAMVPVSFAFLAHLYDPLLLVGLFCLLLSMPALPTAPGTCFWALCMQPFILALALVLYSYCLLAAYCLEQLCLG